MLPQLTLQMKRSAMLACAILALASLAACGPESSAIATVDRTYNVSGPVRLELTNGSGSSRVSVGPVGEVRIHAELRVHAWPWDDPDRKLKELVANPPFSQEGDLIHIGASGWTPTDFSADYTVTVPPDTQMRGFSGSGNLEVDGIAGPANFTVGSGNIRATRIQNDLHVVVGSGNATFTDAKGRIDATTGSGEVVVRGAKGDVHARTGSGEINIEQPGGNVEAMAGSGNIEVRDATADLRLHSGSGEITIDGNPGPAEFLGRPRQFGRRLAARSLRCQLPLLRAQQLGRYQRLWTLGIGNLLQRAARLRGSNWRRQGPRRSRNLVRQHFPTLTQIGRDFALAPLSAASRAAKIVPA